MSKLTFGYWEVRGLAEPSRFLLHYKKVDFVDKLYSFDDDEWARTKSNLGLDFPNLPYLIDGDVKITQSTTILRYLAHKYQLKGNTPEDKIRVSLAEQQLIDIRANWADTIYNPDFENIKADFIKNVPAKFKQFANFLGERKFICGDTLTYVDFMLSQIFDAHSYLIPGLFKECPVLKAHHDRIVSLPGIKEYLSSSTYKRWPISGRMSKFGGSRRTAMFGVSGEEPKRD